jgi:hypothetical protein
MVIEMLLNNDQFTIVDHKHTTTEFPKVSAYLCWLHDMYLG